MHEAAQGRQQAGGPPHPVAEGAGGHPDAAAGDHPGQPVQRQVVGELGREHVGQQARPAQPLGDRADGGGAGGGDPLVRRDRRRVAPAAGVAHPHGAADEERDGVAIQLLGRLLADPGPRPTATRAGPFALAQVVGDGAALQVRGQRRAAVSVPRPGWAVGIRRGDAGACRPLGPAAEGDGQDGVQPGPHVGQLGTEVPHHRVQRRHVGRQRGVIPGGGGHAEGWDTDGEGASVSRRPGCTA